MRHGIFLLARKAGWSTLDSFLSIVVCFSSFAIRLVLHDKKQICVGRSIGLWVRWSLLKIIESCANSLHNFCGGSSSLENFPRSRVSWLTFELLGHAVTQWRTPRRPFGCHRSEKGTSEARTNLLQNNRRVRGFWARCHELRPAFGCE